MTPSAPVPWRALMVLLAANALLGGALALDLRRGAPHTLPAPGLSVTAAPPAAATAPELADPLPSLEPLARYQAILERPLFLPGRRPFTAPKTSAPAVAPPPAGVPTLKGIVVTAGHAVAIFQLPGDAHYISASKGAAVGAWKIEEIAPTGVKLRQGQTGRFVVLEEGAATPRSPVANADAGESAGPRPPGETAAGQAQAPAQ